MRKFMYLFNYISFQVCWVILALRGNDGIIIFGVFLLAHLLLVYYLDNMQALKLELITIGIVCLIGIGIDLTLTSYGIYNFSGLKLLPYWYVTLWLLFATTLNHCFYPFWYLPSIMVSLLAGIFAPIAYLGLEAMASNFSIAEPYEVSLVTIFALWFMLLPLFIQITLFLRKTLLEPQPKR